ncbi:nif-specific transcriptional activator NifA [Aquabacter sp. P-9]|nr:nif-specific transcriptional activator NifA [Aquabacter sp. P-9]MDE1571102.1 nif-specific transcriptional activator NifA [Aquabacter sp. P-9]
MTDFYQVRVPRGSANGPTNANSGSARTVMTSPLVPPMPIRAGEGKAAAPQPAPVAAPRPSAASRGTSPEVALIGIYEISKILTAARRLELTLANVVNVLSSMLQMRHGMIVILDRQGEPDMVATTGWTPQIAQHIRSRVPQKAIDQIVATATPLVVQDVSAHALFEGHEDLFAPAEETTVSFIGVPIKADTRVIGTLSIDRVWDGTARFRFDEDVRFLTMVANLVGQTVRLHEMVAGDRDRLIAQTHRLEKALGGEKEDHFPDLPATGILGDSMSVKRLIATAKIVARSNSTVLLRGESGTGKELFARAIHELSPRKDKPFIKVNCAALPETVLESELFGHEKGAFTGALNARQGRFELAHGGTLFLDEIGEISAAFQAKLLRVLQEGEFERVGGNRTLKVDVRLVCATNKNLEDAVAKGEFRADLYYRINVVPLILPPLRERTGDIPKLARAFLERFNRENQRHMQLSAQSLEVLKKCYFPGNVRELENCVRRTATLAEDDVIVPHDFACDSGQCLSAILWKGSAPKATQNVGVPQSLQPPPLSQNPSAPASPVVPLSAEAPVHTAPPAACPGAEACPVVPPRLSEREQLLQAMERAGWVQAKAARILNLTPRQVGYALRKHDIDIKKF